MIELGAQAKALLGAVGMAALHGTALALVAFVITRGTRLRPAWQAAVWLVVLVKFAVPYAPALPWSLADLLAMLRGDETGGALVLPMATGSRAPVAASIVPALGWLSLASVWFAGVIYIIQRAVRAELSARRTARTAPLAPAEAIGVLHQLATELRVSAPRLVTVDSTTAGPHVVGVLRPTIVIPAALAAEPTLLRAALAHELAHVRRRDAFARIIQIAALALLWFWPVVRLVNRRLELAREQACDAWALEASSIERPAYARLLVRMAQLPAFANALAAPRALDARVTAILGPAARARLTPLHRLALVGWVVLALGGARTAQARGKAEVCVYSPELAEALIEAHPAADRDGDGVVTREEACDFQAEMRRLMTDPPPDAEMTTSEPGGTGGRSASEGRRGVIDQSIGDLLAEPLCCNCDESLGRSSAPETMSLESQCFRDEGAY